MSIAAANVLQKLIKWLTGDAPLRQATSEQTANSIFHICVLENSNVPFLTFTYRV